MKRRIVSNVLIVDDNDLDCKKKDEKEITLDEINIAKLGFIAGDLKGYDIIIYSGKLGKKLLRLRNI